MLPRKSNDKFINLFKFLKLHIFDQSLYCFLERITSCINNWSKNLSDYYCCNIDSFLFYCVATCNYLSKNRSLFFTFSLVEDYQKEFELFITLLLFRLTTNYLFRNTSSYIFFRIEIVYISFVVFLIS